MRRSLVWNGATTGNRSGNSGRNAGVLTRALPAAVVLFVSVALSLYGFSATPALAQMTPVGVGLTIDKTSVTVGDVFTLTLSANHPEGYHVAFPDVPAQWGEFEVREATPLPAVVEPDGTVTSAIEIRATLFEPGIHTTPALSVAVRRPDGSIINRPARPIEVEVESVLSEGGNELRDIKPQADVPFPVTWPWMAGGVAAVAALALLAAWFWRRRMTARDPMVSQEPLTPLAAALAELERLEKLDLPGEGRYNEHYTMLADCLREYLFGQFRIPAPELTTEQTVSVLSRRPVSSANVEDFGEALGEADLVKFARLAPEAGDARNAVSTARRVVTELTATPSRFRPSGGYTSGRYTR